MTLEMLISNRSSNITDQSSSGTIIIRRRNKTSGTAQAAAAEIGNTEQQQPEQQQLEGKEQKVQQNQQLVQVMVDLSNLDLLMKEMVLPRSSSLKTVWDEAEEEENLKYSMLVRLAQRIPGKNTSKNLPLLRQRKEFIVMLQLRQGDSLLSRLTIRFLLSPSLSLSSNQSQIKKKSFPTGRKHLCH